ncbi:hypothetical protein DFH28DRAFT_896980 [Melampsora americana]|nr:hypothetical protein DFH28DRAFT_896980 [Melampsora americana]
MVLQNHYRSCVVPGFGFVRWKNISSTNPLIPDWVIGQYIVIYIEDSRLEPPPKNQLKKIAFPDWNDEIWLNISIPLCAEMEVMVV